MKQKQRCFSHDMAHMIIFRNTTMQYTWSLWLPSQIINIKFFTTVKPVLSGHSKIDKMKVLKTGGTLIQV